MRIDFQSGFRDRPPVVFGWRSLCVFRFLLFSTLLASGCLGKKQQLAINDALVDRMVADLSKSDPSVVEPDSTLSNQPSVLKQTVAEEPATAAHIMTLDSALAEAFRIQPRLKAQLESIEQARQGENIAFAPFLPVVSAGYSVGAYGVSVGGVGIPVPGGGNFNYLPSGGSIPIGFNFSTGYDLAEFRIQWLVTDFGRRLGRFRQAEIGADIARLQAARAYQTVTQEVSMAYFQVLRAQAMAKIAEESVRRCREEEALAEKLALRQAIERENVLRAKVQLSAAQKLLDSAQAAEQIARASLNLAIGLRVSDTTAVEPITELPAFNESLAACLEGAVNSRQEFTVARRTIDSAREGKGIARADFAPRVIADGFYLDYHQAKPGGYVDIPIGSIKLEWGLFEGGRRVAELRVADSKIRSAVAQAESLSDSIAFQVNEAYRLLVASRRAIERCKAPVEQTAETYRIVKARSRVGDATTTELIDAETAMTRAEQEYQAALFDYLASLAKLNYAMGTAPGLMTAQPPARPAVPVEKDS
ncbi:MAG: TolC family protein [Planctomycetota bacterium]